MLSIIKHNNLSAGTRTFKPDTRGAELVPELHIVSENMFVKTKSSALTSEEFAAFIEAHNVTEFYIAGADATACVKSTCYNMAKAGYIDANDVIIRLTREDFASEEEFLKWKMWSDESYHVEDKRDVVDGKRLISIDNLSEAALAVPGIDAVMEHQRKRLEDRNRAVAMVAQVREKLTDTQFRRLWMYYVDGMTIDEIGAAEGVSHQAVSLNIAAAIRKIKKHF